MSNAYEHNAKLVEQYFYDNVDSVLQYLEHAVEEKDFGTVEEMVARLDVYIQETKLLLKYTAPEAKFYRVQDKVEELREKCAEVK